ncbi:extracellular matrix protein 1-like isoform X2 [Parambassis ranga]|uniref:Extracellular matrix protein 1-like isoform X2 n=1 Tax=Parambassis ranga TaxID=210632 RepID=A0A6P7JUC5_9TELE|nr:extracellular matrix protein 1 isoform X2 [Parambassis ranga]
MFPSGAVVCATALVFVSLGAASTDLHEPDLMQRELDLTDLINFKDIARDLTPRGRQPGFSPRSSPTMGDYPIQFPLGRPTPDNLQAICLHGDQRPRYPDSYFPASGFGVVKRRADAVNKAESWFGTCCKGNQTWGSEVTLCCTTQVWEQFVKLFCKEDSSIKAPQYHCCKFGGTHRLNCFNDGAPNPNYGPTEKVPVPPLPSASSFSFDPNTCQRERANRRNKKKKQPTAQKTHINFPPGRPTADNIDSLCRNQNLRPLFNIKCLSGPGNKMLAHQAKTINRVEKGFKQCCKKKKGLLSCADQKWREGLNTFCLAENGQQVDFKCCVGNEENERHNCFQSVSPDPFYNMTSATEELSLNQICDTHKIIMKRFPVGFSLNSFVNQCCPLSEQEKTACSVQRLEEMSRDACLMQRSTHDDIRRCCIMPSQEVPQCISKILMDAVTRATEVLHQKMRKRCPAS